MKRTPLRRTAGGLRRTPISSKRTPIKPVSDKRKVENNQRRDVVAKMRAAEPWCMLGLRGVCQGAAAHAHEPKMRSRGVDITDPDEIVMLCAACHDWVHLHPILAECHGLMIPAWHRSVNTLESFRELSRNPQPPSWRTDPGWRAEALSQLERLYSP